MAATKTDSAYVDAELEVAGAADGPLAGLTFAVKDMFDVRALMPAFTLSWPSGGPHLAVYPG